MENNQTESELLFEQICRKRKITYDPILRSGNRTPDYLIKIGENDIVIEVKQLNQNKNDVKRYDNVFKEKKSIVFFPDHKSRVRKKIKIASKQLRQFSKNKNSAILVLYDNTHGFSTLNNYSILTSMYGDESIPILVDKKNEPFAGPTRFGNEKKMTEKNKNYISAVGMINIINSEPELDLFHNVYADFPINFSIAGVLVRKQYTLPPGHPNMYREWEEIIL